MFPMISLVVFYKILKQVLLLISVLLCYSASDFMLHHKSIQVFPWKRAITDNLSHISLGIISWIIVINIGSTHQLSHITCSILCGLFAGGIDVDHFLMAKSYKLTDALNLPSRPPFHNTTLIMSSVISMILILHSFEYKRLEYIGWILLVAAVSHHLRDSLHRGLWLWPVSLKPFSKLNCIILSYAFPALIGLLMNLIYKPSELNDYVIV